jgi:multiple sugar transport system permease protein
MAIQSARGVPTAKVAPRKAAGFRARSKRLLGRDWPIAYLFAAPLVLLLFGLIGYPLVRALVLSFFGIVGPVNRGFVGLENYQRLWGDSQFRGSVANTFKFALISVFIKFWVGLTAALLLHRLKRLRSVFTGLVLLPWIIPEVVAALTWRGLYDPVFGGLNQLLLSLGLITQGIAWTGDYTLALPSVIAVNVWKGIPFFTIILLSGLKSIDAELYDAAAVDGANGWQRFLNITLPGLRYVIIVACLLSLIFTLNAFGLVYLLTGGGPGGATRIFSILAYEIFNERRYGLATATAMAVVPVLLVLIVILGRYMGRDLSKLGGDEGRFGGALRGVGRAAAAVLAAFALWAMFGVRGALTVLALGVFVLGALIALPLVLGALGRLVSRAYAQGDYGREARLRRVTRRLGDGGAMLVLGALLFFELFPFYWVIITAFKTDSQMREFRSIFWPSPWTTEHFTHMLTQTQYPRWFANTVTVATVSCLISVLVGALGAYALVRLRWRGQAFMSTAILFTYLMPGVMLFIPLYQIFTQLRLVNTLQALMVAYPTFGLPFACWLLMGYYRSIPGELEEAALIDGANYFQAFFRIILPLTLPALLTVGLFAITGAFNDFLFAYVFVRPESLTTLSVGLYKMVIGDIFPFGKMFAASIMTAIPVTILYMLAQRFMVEGLTAGSVKG